MKRGKLWSFAHITKPVRNVDLQLIGLEQHFTKNSLKIIWDILHDIAYRASWVNTLKPKQNRAMLR